MDQQAWLEDIGEASRFLGHRPLLVDIFTIISACRTAAGIQRGAIVGLSGGPGSGKTLLCRSVVAATNAGGWPARIADLSQLSTAITRTFEADALGRLLEPRTGLTVFDSLDAIRPMSSDLQVLFRDHLEQAKFSGPNCLILVTSTGPFEPEYAELLDLVLDLALEEEARRHIIAELAPDCACIDALAGLTNAHGYHDLCRLLADCPRDSTVGRYAEHIREHRPWLVRQLVDSAGIGTASGDYSRFALEDLGGVEEQIAEARRSIVQPFLDPERYLSAGIALPRGLLLYGPTGCGKTHLAVALARASPLAFLHVDATCLRSKYLGDTEKRIVAVFRQARSIAPCALFFDHLETLLPRRHSPGSGPGGSEERIVTCFLTEMDGVFSCSGSRADRAVVVFAAAVDPEAVDPAILRPGRIGVHIGLFPPDSDDKRRAVIECALRGLQHRLSPEFVGWLASQAVGRTPADLRGWILRAAHRAVQEGKRPVLLETDFHNLPVGEPSPPAAFV